jgi:hypothetical protein
MQQNQGCSLLLVALLFNAILLCASASHPFFWDTILTSTIADWFYQHGTATFIPPTDLDAGHPPFFQLYLSLCWQLFGQNLAVSHWAMAPFLALLAWAAVNLILLFIHRKLLQWLSLLLVLLHPFLLTQSMMVSYDIAMLAFFAVALLATARQSAFLLTIAVLGLSALSLRGQIMGAGVLLGYVLAHRHIWKSAVPAIVVWCILFTGWHGYHFLQTGWMISTPSSHWNTQRGFADGSTIISNMIGIIRGFIDYGTIGLTLTALLSSVLAFRFRRPNRPSSAILIVGILTWTILVLAMLPFKNPIGHRYWMSFHFLMIILTVHHLSQFRFAVPVILFIATGFITGHFWLYPENRSNGWDVTLAHLPYHKNRHALLKEMQSQGWDMKGAGSAFPLFCSTQQTDLSPGKRMSDVSEVEYRQLNQLIYSPICNDINKEQLQAWKTSHTLSKVIGDISSPSRIEIYTKNSPGPILED